MNFCKFNAGALECYNFQNTKQNAIGAANEDRQLAIDAIILEYSFALFIRINLHFTVFMA